MCWSTGVKGDPGIRFAEHGAAGRVAARPDVRAHRGSLGAGGGDRRGVRRTGGFGRGRAARGEQSLVVGGGAGTFGGGGAWGFWLRGTPVSLQLPAAAGRPA